MIVSKRAKTGLTAAIFNAFEVSYVVLNAVKAALLTATASAVFSNKTARPP